MSNNKNLENYVPVNVRVVEARQKYGEELSILTEVKLYPEQGAAVVIAAIVVGTRKLANGHSMTTSLNDKKALEKAESIAVGRALAFAGFSADAALASAEEMEDVVTEETPATTAFKPAFATAPVAAPFTLTVNTDATRAPAPVAAPVGTPAVKPSLLQQYSKKPAFGQPK
jgi:hypothetical protein